MDGEKETSKLLHELKKATNLRQVLDENEAEFKSSEMVTYLKELLAEKKLTKASVIRAARLHETYGYQIFSGVRRPSRDRTIALSFGFKLSGLEASRLLKYTEYPPLYAKNRRDAIIIFALDHGYTLDQTNDSLYDLEKKKALIETYKEEKPLI
ncbi:ATP synthase subunit alpha [Listeria monocytogenes SHL005]|uniref:hypothetical protein n=2 Tax=Listeria monocytogenes TaxID=1639 RepID=UPI0005447CFB|nr:hypothetical protein [Listeria monocytogenes]KHK15764.1 ATP synthase subunit alpha [Listeria monocytogenes SHL005]